MDPRESAGGTGDSRETDPAASGAREARAAESVCTGRPTRHHDDDDTRTAVEYCTAAGYGGDVMPVVFSTESARVRRWLGRHRSHLAAVARALLERGSIDGNELFALVRGLAPLRPMPQTV